MEGGGKTDELNMNAKIMYKVYISSHRRMFRGGRMFTLSEIPAPPSTRSTPLTYHEDLPPWINDEGKQTKESRE
jgi:hypothetical protein